MKKIMFAVALTAGFAAFGDGIASANTVGYIQQTLGENQYVHTVGVNFKNCGVADGSYTIGTTIFSDTAASGDTIYIFDPNNWDLAFYQFLGYGTSSESLGWSYVGADGSSGEVATFTVNKGEVVYFMPADAVSSSTVAGEVESSSSKTVTFTVGTDYVFPIANPYPIDTTFASLETFVQSGDTLYVFDAENWDLAFYTFLGFEGTTSQGWSFSGADGSSSNINTPEQVVIPAGKGAFLMPGDSRSWTVSLAE